MEIFADTLVGNIKIETSGGDGNQGKDGSKGANGFETLKVWRFEAIEREHPRKKNDPHSELPFKFQWFEIVEFAMQEMTSLFYLV